MTKENITTQDKLKKLLSYNCKTGDFIWISKTSKYSNIKLYSVSGTEQSNGYITIGINGYIYQAHRLAWLYIYGEWPVYEIDHIDGDRSNNRILNLRDVTHSNNQRNMRKRSPTITGINGVYRANNRYYAQIYNGKKNIHIGMFNTIEEAKKARKIENTKNNYSLKHGETT